MGFTEGMRADRLGIRHERKGRGNIATLQKTKANVVSSHDKYPNSIELIMDRDGSARFHGAGTCNTNECGIRF
ncbi:MAG: hypothetical protein NTZ39_09350 [Methanoregula sp.]|nr:hypothetical protein [Methanoregula sp.]